MQITAVLLGILTITSYRPVPQQTKPECRNRYDCTTSVGENVSELGVAVSPDLLASGRVHYGDVVFIENVGFRIVNDVMAKRNKNAIDVFVYTKSEEKHIGTRHWKAWVISHEM